MSEENYLAYYSRFIRNRITELRISKDVSEREVSMSIDQNDNYINQVCSGRFLPSMSNFLSICEYFEITPYEFFHPALKDPIAANKIYNELTRLAGNQFDQYLEILQSMTKEQFIAVLDIFKNYKGT